MVEKIVNFVLRKDVTSFLVLLAVMSGIGLSVASQYLFGFQPCNLCITQRYILIVAFISVSCALFYRANGKLCSIFLAVTACLLLFVFCAAIYQVCIQYEIILEPKFCIKNDLSDKSVDELINQLQNTSTGSCKDFGPLIFGIPMSIFSAAGTFSLLVYIVTTLIKTRVRS